MIALMLSSLFVEVAEAAVTGAVRGHVEDDAGMAVPGAQVRLTGAQIAGEQAVMTDDDGNFRFPSVPVGTHTLQVAGPGLTPIKLTVTVRLDETAFVPVTLTSSGSEEIEVVAELPVIDATRSSFSTQLSKETLDNLPTGRTYQDAVNMLPGVSGRVDTSSGGPGDGNPSVRGEGQYGNNYFFDGISTRDPDTKTFGGNVPFDAIEEIQVYTDGAPAEFGQATGMMVNVVTKDGGDEHFGSVYYGVSLDASFSDTYLIVDLDKHKEVETTKRDFLSNSISLTVGGPIVKEKLWYFASLDLGASSTAYEGAEVINGEATRTETQGFQGFAKMTYFITPDLSVQYQIGGGSDATPNSITSSQYLAAAQTKDTSSEMTHLATLRWHPDAFSELELKALYSNTSIDSVPMSGDEDAPQFFNLDTGQYSGNADSYDLNDRGRLGWTGSVTHLVTNSSGEHKVKLGVEQWVLTSSRELIYTGPDEGAQYNLDEAHPCDTPDYSNCAGYTTYNEVGALGHTGDVFSGYLQDDWKPTEPLTMNVGVRTDHEALYQNAGEKFVEAWMFSPRMGMAWDVTKDSKTVLSFNYGRYFDVQGNAFADWGDTRSAYSYRQYEFNDDTGAYDLVWVQDPSGNPATVDDDLRPFHMDKIALGFKRELFPMFAVGIRGILSKTSDIPEDIDIDGSSFEIANPQNKWRDYRALELTAEKKFSDHWQLLASYTLSESKGHMPGQFELASGGQYGSDGNQVGVYLDDVNNMESREELFDSGNGWLLAGLAGLGTETDDAGYYGYLPYHAFHSVKINGSYTFELGKADVTPGLIYEYSSGNAWQKRGYVDLYGDYYAFPEGRGSRFMPATHYVDFRIAGGYDLGHNRDMTLALDVFNLPDLDQAVTYYENDDESFGLTLYRQAPRSILASVEFTY